MWQFRTLCIGVVFAESADMMPISSVVDIHINQGIAVPAVIGCSDLRRFQTQSWQLSETYDSYMPYQSLFFIPDLLLGSGLLVSFCGGCRGGGFV
jgi:hypothetical protein